MKCTRCKKRPAVYYRHASGERLCTECLTRSLLRTLRHTLRKETPDLPTRKTLIIVFDTCRPLESIALLHMLSMHVARLTPISRIEDVTIVVLTGSLLPQNTLARYTVDITRKLNANLHVEIFAPGDRGAHPLTRAAERLHKLLTHITRLLKEVDGTALLPYPADVLAQWATALLLIKPGSPVIFSNLAGRVATPLKHTSYDYTAYVYTRLMNNPELQRLDPDPCRLTEIHLTLLQRRSPEYIYGPLKTLSLLADRLGANKVEANT